MAGTYLNPINIDAELGSANNPMFIHDSDSEDTVSINYSSSINYSAHAQNPNDYGSASCDTLPMSQESATNDNGLGDYEIPANYWLQYSLQHKTIHSN